MKQFLKTIFLVSILATRATAMPLALSSNSPAVVPRGSDADDAYHTITPHDNEKRGDDADDAYHTITPHEMEKRGDDADDAYHTITPHEMEKQNLQKQDARHYRHQHPHRQPSRPGCRGPRSRPRPRRPPDTKRKSRTSCVDVEPTIHFRDSYTVYGSDYHDDMVGKWGEHLRNQLKGCGATSDWHFEYDQTDAFQKHWDWKSWWNLPIGQHDCVQKAINAVGGDNVDCIIVKSNGL
ncbi:hypothetical protein PG996_011448 [Apiospora saccharicola]|uniref:Uncharacterized protein n=1 Tax=Apiospora saccharicola TaxID=335842 RepID=A0ABR1UF34_9PEZI